MRSYLQTGIDWMGGGYFAPAPALDALSKLSATEQAAWMAWMGRLQEAKTGRFDHIHDLVAIYRVTGDWGLRSCCHHLLSDAGSFAMHARMAHEFSSPLVDPLIAMMMRVDYAMAFARAGHLALVPVIVDCFKQVSTLDDAEMIPVALSDMLYASADESARPEWSTSLEEYCATVTARAAELQMRFGERAIVLRGEPFAVRALGRRLLDSLAKPPFQLWLRQKFESSTGIDTRAFYKDGRLQPLAAAAIVEDFLASPEADRYEDGVRYFFGHRLD